jgi:hypothetical protein
MLVTINFFCQGISPVCAYLEIVGDPASGSGQVLVVDCSLTVRTGVGGIMYVNSDGTCTCYDAIIDTNWGQIKALYQ